MCQNESDAGSTTTDTFEDEISDSEYAQILMGTDNTHDDNNNKVEIPQHDTERKKNTDSTLNQPRKDYPRQMVTATIATTFIPLKYYLNRNQFET